MSTNTKLAEALRLGQEGAPATEEERLLFEAWMRGHCWALCATWNGTQYVSDAEQGGNVDPRAMNTRQIFAAWRDRGALAAHDAEQAQEPVAWRVWRGDSYELFFNEEAAKRRCECFIRKGKPEPLYAAPVEQSAKAVPAGFKLVPVEPTPKMIERGRWDEFGEDCTRAYPVPDYYVTDVWAAMLAAAPTPPAPEAKSCLITGTCKHGSWCSEVYCQEHCQFVEAQAAPEAQQAAGQEPYTSDRHFALREAHCIGDGEKFWKARPGTDKDNGRAIAFDDGYVRGFDKGTELADARAALAQRREPLTDEQIAEGRYRTWAAEPDDAPEAWAFMRGARWAEKHFGIGATTGEQR